MADLDKNLLDWLVEWEQKQNYLKGYTTITEYEKFMLCYYLLNFINFIEVDKHEFKPFYSKLIQVLNLENTKYPKYLKTHNYEKNVNFRKKLKTILINKLKSIKYKQSEIEKRLKIISDIYSLDDIEYGFLNYFMLKEITTLIGQISALFDISFSELEIFGAQCLKLKSWAIPQYRKNLLNKGIFIKRDINDDTIYLSPKIIQVFSDADIKTLTQIKNLLLGKNQKSKLNWKDFDHLEKERNTALKILTAAIQNQTKGINILLYGSVGTGKTQFAKLIANKAKCDMYSITSEFMGKEASRKDRLSDLSSKQTILSKSLNSCLLFDEAEDVMNRGFSEFGSASKAYLNALLEETPIPIFWTTNNIYTVDPAFLRRMTYTIEFEKLPDDIRLNIWKKAVRKNKLKVNKEKLTELNKNYDIPVSLISNAVKTTRLINGSQDDFEIFVENVAKVVNKKKNVKKKKDFEMKEYNSNLVNTDLDIKDLTSKIKSCGKLNFSLCLYGEPGTGKSLYARYLAKELGLEVVTKQASDLISKYVGETEQNIANAFAEAKSKNAMLIFDEVDSFLQNRNNAVRNWEVSQVNEMLTWMEIHEYPFVCTTNLLDSLDEASLRRFTFKIKFDFMTQEQVALAMSHFFGIENSDLIIKGLTTGDFATVKKKADFLNITNIEDISRMLQEEVKIKKSKVLQNSIGF